MANSKSNIYPIQLQNAELNLNKYDAEIKQYTGFNKNNAPFVGGCLSNLFTKDTTIEGADGQNVYIAPNGDVYVANNEGLYKNDVLLFSKEGEALKIEEKEMPKDLYYYYNDEVYITQELVEGNFYTSFRFHCGDYEDLIYPYSYSGYTYTMNTSFDIEYMYDETLGDIYCVAWQGYTNDTSSNRGLVRIFLYIKDSEDNVTKQEFDILENDFVINKVRDAVGKVCMFKMDDSTGFFVAGSGNAKRGLIYNNSEWTLYNGYIATIVDGHYDIEYFSFYKKNYYGQIIAGRNKISGNQSMYCNITRIYLNNGYVRFEYTYLDSILNTGTNYNSYEYNNTVKTYYGGLSILKTYDTSTSKGISACCLDSALVTTVKGEDDFTVDIGCLVGGFILMNNNVVTGLSLGGNILLTEWNSVDSDGKDIYYFYDKQELIYKNVINNKWYKITIGTPSVFFANNQVITNFNQIRNAYSLSRNKNVIFANAFNNRFCYRQRMIACSSTQNSRYLALSINEYDLEDNASIILNPVPIATSNLVTGTYKFSYKNEVVINVYASDDLGSQVLYFDSYLIRGNSLSSSSSYLVFSNPDLIGLPFPSDTNGNVPYTPSLFAQFFSSFGNDIFVKEGSNTYQLSKSNNQPVMSFYLGTLIEGLTDVFILQGQYYGIINNQIFAIQFMNGVVASQTSVVSTIGLQFCGNTPYEALFFSATNRCLYSFNGANVLNPKQFVDKISEVRGYKYNPSTQSIFLLTDIGVIASSLFGIYQIDMTNCIDVFLLDNGLILQDSDNNFRYIRYYKTDDSFTKQDIELETCFYGSNNTLVTINDCLYFRLFSEEAEGGEVEVSATTLNNKGRITEKTVYKIKASDWDPVTKTVYYRYQPKEQRGLGISFKITSPFKIAALSIGTQADAILIDKVSKGAINAPERTSSITEW